MAQRDPLIVVIDDTPEDRAAVRRYLTEDHVQYRFLEFESPAEALEAVQSAPPACLLLDYGLDGTDGLEVLERLTGGTGIAPFAIVMLTGRGSEAVAVQALKRGAVDYLVKGGYSPSQLQATVAEAIAKFADRPSVEQRRAERERAHRATRDAVSGHERLVLIVDDSPEDRVAVRRALNRNGSPSYRFLEEGTGGEALALCRSAGLDCLLLDYSLPDLDGLEFLNELTGGTGITPFPVIMLTGRGDETVAAQALKRGAADYLVKGRLTSDALRAIVEQAIERVAARRVQEEQRVRVLERLEAEARQRADQLIEADRRKDEFLAMLAHELRNPLAPVANALHLLRLIGPMPDAAKEVIDVAARQVKHLARLVDDLMEVSRITRGKIALKKEILELGPVVRRSIEAVRPLIDTQGHELILNLPATPIYLDADPTRLEQVFTNLLNNAAKYTDSGGLIKVDVGLEEGMAVVRVTDTGVGIDVEMLPQIFELFAQADRSLDRARGGLGIGLTLVRSLTEQHGGAVEARSDGVGKGTEFSVRMPITEPDRARRMAQGKGMQSHENIPLKVLLVDDNVDGTNTLAMLFRAMGYEVHTAYDGLAGLEAVRAIRPDVIFLDIGLPCMNGYDVARTVRAELGGESPLLIAVTGYGQTEDRRRAEEAGFRHHLVKPVDPDELLRLAAEAQHRLRQASANWR